MPLFNPEYPGSNQSPGDVIQRYIIEGLGIGVRQLAHALNVPPNRLYQIIQNKRDISVDTAVRLGLYLNMDAEFWLDIQTRYKMNIFKHSVPQINEEVTPLKHKTGSMV